MDSQLIHYLVYLIGFLLFFYITFKVLRGLNIENKFKANHVWEITAAYIIMSLISAHILSEILLKVLEWILYIIS